DVPPAARLEERAAAMQASLDVEHGPLFRVAYFDAGRRAPGRLLWVVHHLAVDIVSWRVLAEGLSPAYEAIAARETCSLPPTPSFVRWAQRLDAFAASRDVEMESGDWLTRVAGAAPLPEDGPGGENTQSTVQVMSAWLGAEETARLVREGPRRMRTR